MATELEELVDFLSSPSPQVTKAAVDIVRGLTGSGEGLQSLANYAKTLLPSLSRLLSAPKEVSEPAAEALVNLSQDSKLAAKMVEMGMVTTIMDILHKPQTSVVRLLVMLLVNLTQLDAGITSLLQMGMVTTIMDILHKPQTSVARLLVMLLINLTQLEAGITFLLQIGDSKMQGLYVMKLVRSFCQSFHDGDDDPFEHVGSILVNISKQEAGRKLLLDPKRGLMKQIVRQFDSSSALRKKGVSGTIRNCCFEAESELNNLLLVSEFLWPALLLPVAGNKVYGEQDRSKMPLELSSALAIEREPVDDPEIRVQALEAIYLISLQDAGRRALWSVNGPRIVQVGYEDEEDPKVMEAYEQLGSLLVHGSGTEELSNEPST